MFGMSDHDTAVYRALLRHPDASTGELARSARTSVAAAGRALDAMAKNGLVVADPDASCGLRPVRPDAARAQELLWRQRDVTQRTSELEATRADVATALDDYLAGRELLRPAAEIERIDGIPAIRERMDELVAQTQHELLAIVTMFDDDPDAVDAARDEDLEILARGVRVRTVYPITLRDMPITWAYAAEMAAAGEEIRLTDEVPARLLVIDREIAVMPADAHDIESGAVVVQCPPVVATMVALFELTWARAAPLSAGTPALNERDATLLALLAAGAKDESTARHLGCNVRTARRDIARLMSELGAASRFQAGVVAARRGWV